MAFLLPTLGVCLCAAGVILIFLKRETLSVAILILPGIVLCCLSVPNLLGFQFGILGFTGSVTMQEVSSAVKEAKLDIKQEDIGKINLEVQSLRDALAAQAKFNQQVQHNMSVIKVTANANDLQTNEKPDINALTDSFAHRAAYSAIVFYRDSRKKDSATIVSGLVKAGFQASSINSSLDETKVGAQPDNSTYVTPNAASPLVAKDAAVMDKMSDLIRSSLPAPRNGAVTVSAPHSLSRGDVQIYLY